jgi:hypothetical protein
MNRAGPSWSKFVFLLLWLSYWLGAFFGSHS